MLPLAYRLKKEKEIKRALSGRLVRRCGLLVCRAAPNGLDVSRFCFVVSRKVSGSAVVRNRVKRLLRQSVAAFLPKIKPGLDYVFIAYPGIEKNRYESMASAVAGCLGFPFLNKR